MYTIHVNAVDRDITVDWDNLPESAQAFIIQYGLKQKFNDCHVSAETPDEKNAMVDKTLDALKSGEIRIGAARATDRVAAEIKRLATSLAKDRAKKDGKKLTPEYLKGDSFADLVAKYAANEQVVATAKANVESVKALADLS